MATGDTWGTADELLHPRDRNGRFRSAWKMSGAAVKRTMAVLSGFSPKEFPSDEAASNYLKDVGRYRKSGYGSLTSVPQYLRDSAETNKKLRAGQTDSPQVRAMDSAMRPLPEDLILSRVVGPEAFGLKPESLDRLEDYTGKLVSDRAYGSTNIGTPLQGSGGPRITMVIATPAGTSAVIPQNPGSREVVLDRDQPIRITKVQPDGQGGYYVLAVAVQKGAAGNVRTKKLGTRAPRPTAPDEPVPVPDKVATPAVPTQDPAQVPPAPSTGAPVPPASRQETVVTEAVGDGGPTRAKRTRASKGATLGSGQAMIEQMMAEGDAEVAGVMELIGEEGLPTDPFLKAYIGIVMAQLRGKRKGKAAVVKEIREKVQEWPSFGDRKEAARILGKLADKIETTSTRSGGSNTAKLKPDAPAAQVIGEPKDRVREAVRAALEKSRSDWVSLTDIRQALSDLSHEEQDRVLKDMMINDDDVSIVPQSNQKTLTDRDRKDALMVGGQMRHAVHIADLVRQRDEAKRKES